MSKSAADVGQPTLTFTLFVVEKPAGVDTWSVKSSQDWGTVQLIDPVCPDAFGTTNGPPPQVTAALVSVKVPDDGVEASARSWLPDTAIADVVINTART